MKKKKKLREPKAIKDFLLEEVRMSDIKFSVAILKYLDSALPLFAKLRPLLERTHSYQKFHLLSL